MSRAAPLVLLLVVLPMLDLAAQANPALVAGARVRVTTGDPTSLSHTVGTLVADIDDSLRLQPEGQGGSVSIARGAITRLEFSEGQRSSAGRGALVGFGVGALSGALIGAASSGCSSDAWLCPDPGPAACARAARDRSQSPASHCPTAGDSLAPARPLVRRARARRPGWFAALRRRGHPPGLVWSGGVAPPLSAES